MVSVGEGEWRGLGELRGYGWTMLVVIYYLSEEGW